MPIPHLLLKGKVGFFLNMNQNPEQIARDQIDQMLIDCGWVVQRKTKINLSAGLGVAVTEYQTETGPVDYLLFIDKKPVGVIEAKKAEEGVRLLQVEDQTKRYADGKLKYLNNDPLFFGYESTGEVTRFTDYRDPKPRSRTLFDFHRPETLAKWLSEEKTLRARFFDLPELNTDDLRECQVNAITKLETSFKENRPKALIQMATGSGKTFTAITFIYRLLKFAKAKRVLFLVDTKNLGEQAEQEFMAYVPNDDNRKFTELYGVQRLRRGTFSPDNQVYISTIQRFYSILKDEELDESAEETNPNESRAWEKREPVPVVYNPKIPVEFFDFVIVDECHRSIYNLWKQVLDYFDSFLIGLTATPDNRTFGFFNQNVVSEYTHEQAVTDGVNVGFDVYLIETEVSKKGGVVWKGEYVDHREKDTRRKRWEQLDEDKVYSNKQLDNEVVNPNQIRLIIKTFKEHLPHIFQDRVDEHGVFEIPKTLIFAKTDSHADDIIQIVREEFAEENKFCKKITYGTTKDKKDDKGNVVEKGEDPKSTLAQFRNDYYPRIAVTVDMIATGTDVKPLECLLFMRDVKSRNYFEQMKGRGTRTIDLDTLRKVTPTAKFTKDHFVIIDAIGVTKSLKTDSRPLEKKPGVPLKDLLGAITVGARDEELFTSLAGRLARLEKQITEKEKTTFQEKAEGKTITEVVKGLLNAFNPDTLADIRAQVEQQFAGEAPKLKDEKYEQRVTALQDKAADVFNGDLNEYIENVRRAHAQVIDHINPDKLVNVGWDKDNTEKAQTLIKDFTQWIETHKDEITALQVFYSQPYRRRQLTYTMIKDVYELLKAEKPMLAPMHVWRAYEQLGQSNGSPKNELIALVSLIRAVSGIDQSLTAFDRTVDKNFQEWVFKKQAGALKFTEEQMQWLRMIKDYVAASFHITTEDFDLSPFNAAGGLGKYYQLFREDYEKILDELNESLAA
ncbi:type I restriction enzyme, R subunit [Ohtaekwangia koreensis]|uniref:Type I restriction enzyme, R subunit n=2 Tax=Ohtaekwangia koreensis TaxID=688867 RepID=A0A1T5MA58_9BACT|nr:type I restriction enzyme, R subunit [Ohtaekwangia koreensis]